MARSGASGLSVIEQPADQQRVQQQIGLSNGQLVVPHGLESDVDS